MQCLALGKDGSTNEKLSFKMSFPLLYSSTISTRSCRELLTQRRKRFDINDATQEKNLSSLSRRLTACNKKTLIENNSQSNNYQHIIFFAFGFRNCIAYRSSCYYMFKIIYMCTIHVCDLVKKIYCNVTIFFSFINKFTYKYRVETMKYPCRKRNKLKSIYAINLITDGMRIDE